MVELRLDALLPLAALVLQGVAQPDLGAQLENVLGRDPRLGHSPRLEQLAQTPGILAIGLGTLLGAAQRAGLRRLGEMHLGTDRAQLLDHEAPAGRRLERRLDLLSIPAAQPAPEAEPIGRPDATTAHLTGGRVERIERDLLSVPVKGHNDPHRGPPQAPSIDDIRADHPRLS